MNKQVSYAYQHLSRTETLGKCIHGSMYLCPALLIALGKFEYYGSGGCQIGDSIDSHNRPFWSCLSNAIHSGPFVTKAKEEFSNSKNSNIQKWSAYISGNVLRQDFLRTALEWVSKDHIDAYMSKHRFDDNIDELKAYFNSVIDWISSVFIDVDSKMCGLKWGRLYEQYHKNSYNPQEVSVKVRELLEDPCVTDKKGIWEYILDGCQHSELLNIRVFDEPTKKSVYMQQTRKAQEKGVSNCPLCALGHDSNKTRIWTQKEMDADHVTAWSKGGATDIKNCQMLCKTHNRAKGNK